MVAKLGQAALQIDPYTPLLGCLRSVTPRRARRGMHHDRGDEAANAGEHPGVAVGTAAFQFLGEFHHVALIAGESLRVQRDNVVGLLG